VYRVEDDKRREQADREAEDARAADRETIRALRDPLYPLARPRGPRRLFRYWRGILGFFVFGTFSLPLLYVIAIAVSPPMTSDGHPVMPIGQVAFAIVFAPVVGAVAGYFLGR
jgi:hypothetical protein